LGFWIQHGTVSHVLLLYRRSHETGTSIPSTRCNINGADHALYNSSVSSTYNVSNTWTTDIYRPRLVKFAGYLATEKANIGIDHSLEISSFEFIEADHADPFGFVSLYTLFDGVIGLAPFEVDIPEIGTPSLLKALVTQRKLERNLFTLQLEQPQNHGKVERRAADVFSQIQTGKTEALHFEGELLLGKVPEVGQTVARVPLSESSYDLGLWSVDVDALICNGKSFRKLPKNATMVILLRSQRIGLPWQLADFLNEHITTHEDFVDCDGRSQLPELRFTLKGGAELVLNGFDYTIEQHQQDGSILCFTNIDRAADPAAAVIQLGYEGLRQFITVFDLEQKEITCAYIYFIQYLSSLVTKLQFPLCRVLIVWHSDELRLEQELF
jgi:hypothetical protein